MMAKKQTLSTALSHPEKVFGLRKATPSSTWQTFIKKCFPCSGPLSSDRILTLERCPDGMSGECFYQKEKPGNMPPDTRTKKIVNASGAREATNYVVGGSSRRRLPWSISAAFRCM